MNQYIFGVFGATTQNPAQPLQAEKDDAVVLKYSDPIAVQPESATRMQVPSGIPATGGQNDIMLLYRDTVTDGPQSRPPALAAIGCCSACGCTLTQYGNCPNGQCPRQQPQQQQQPPQQEYGQDRGGGLFPSLPPRREPDQRLLPQPRDFLPEQLQLPTLKDALPWIIVALFALFLLYRYVKSRIVEIINNAARQQRLDDDSRRSQS